jgi:hypothetical protein
MSLLQEAKKLMKVYEDKHGATWSIGDFDNLEYVVDILKTAHGRRIIIESKPCDLYRITFQDSQTGATEVFRDDFQNFPEK